MKNRLSTLLALIGLLTACTPFTPVVSPGETESLSSTRAPIATKPPVTMPAEPTADAAIVPVQLTSTPVITPTEEPPAAENVTVPVLTPSLNIGKGIPTSLAVSPDGKWMAVGTPFGVHQYHAGTFEQAWFTPLEEQAGRLLYNGQSDRLGVRTGGGITILDPATGDRLAALDDSGSSFAWSPDGKRLVSGGGCEQVTVWDAEKTVVLAELRGGKCSEGYSGATVIWAPDGTMYGAVMGSEIFAWDGVTYNPKEIAAKGAGGTWISSLLAAPSGSLIAQRDTMGIPVVAVIDSRQDRRLHLLDRQVNGPISTLAWAPDGQRLAVAYGMNTGLVLIWNAQTGELEREIEGFYTAVGLGWSPDGQILYGLESPDGLINAVEVTTGRILRTLVDYTKAAYFLTWTEDGLVSTNGVTLTWWDPSTGQPLRQETAGSPENWVISWPPAGPGTYLHSSPLQGQQVGTQKSQKLLIGNSNQNPFVTTWSWDGTRLANASGVWDARTGEPLSYLQDLAQQHNPDQVAWSPDGSRLASADSLNMQSPVIWDANTGAVLHTLPAETGLLRPIWLGLAWSPDGKELAGVGALMHPDSGKDVGMILIWDVQTGQQIHLLTAAMKDIRLSSVAWSPDGHFLVCTTGQEIFVWELTNHTPIARLQGHRDVIDSLAWSPDSGRLASVSRDGTLQLWDISSFK